MSDETAMCGPPSLTQIFWCAAERPRSVLQFLGKSEIGDFQVAISVDEQILWLQITIDNRQRMQILERQDDFGRIEIGYVGAQEREQERENKTNKQTIWISFERHQTT